MLARALPDTPCSVILDEAEWQAFYCRIHRDTTPPAQPPPLATTVRWLAQLGGYLNRKGDGTQMPDPVLFTEMPNNVTRLGRIHPAQTESVAP